MIQVEGTKSLLDKLDELPKKMQKKIMKKGIRAGCAPIVKSAKSNLTQNKRYGFLKKAMMQKVKTYKYATVGIVGAKWAYIPLPNSDKQANPGKYAHLLERGTAEHHYKKREGYHPGARPYPFLDPALQENEDKVTKLMKEKILDELEKEVK